VPLKIHSIFRPSRDSDWVRMSGEEMVRGVPDEAESDGKIL